MVRVSKILKHQSISVLAISSLLISPSATGNQIEQNNASPQIDFVEAQDVGVGATAGFSVTYTNAALVNGNLIDAKVTILDVVNLDRDDDDSNGADLLVDEVDDYSANANTNKELSADIDVFGTNELNTGYADYRIDFFYSGTTSPISIENLVFHVKDIDSRQFLQVSNPSSYALTEDTELVVQRTLDDPNIPLDAIRFAEPDGNSSNSADEENWAEVRYASASFVIFRLGAKESGSASFGVSFKSAGFTSPVAVVESTLIYDRIVESVQIKVPPSTARLLIAKPNGKSGIKLTFKKPYSFGTGTVIGYEIFRNGKRVTQISPSQLFFVDKNVEGNTSYSYQIVVKTSDGISKRSRSSNSITREKR